MGGWVDGLKYKSFTSNADMTCIPLPEMKYIFSTTLDIILDG